MPGATSVSFLGYRRTRRLASLDGLRCLAVLPVLWHHSTPAPPSGLLGRGPLGVDLFFVISGFLITTLLLRERRDRGSVAIGRFYARRALRIFPAYYLVLGLYLARALFFMAPSPTRDHFLHNVPCWATFTGNWFVDFAVPYPVVFAFGWSLAVEEQFYAAWPWFTRGPRWLLPLAALALLVLDQSVERGIVGAGWSPLAQRIAASIATPICLGALVACLLDERAGFGPASALLGRRLAAPTLAAILVALLADLSASLLMIHLVMALLVAACCIRSDHGLAWLVDARPVSWMGSISYGLYLVHVAAITAVKRVFPGHASDAPFVFVAGLVVAVPLAWGLHKAVEVPLLGLRARLRGARVRPGA
jgi:peptidoglycan/LPS O-acetylase OafA/YrhL